MCSQQLLSVDGRMEVEKGMEKEGGEGNSLSFVFCFFILVEQ